jgi:hypothetical protein
VTNHVCSPGAVSHSGDTLRTNCTICGTALQAFLIEDDDRRPRPSGWVPVINRNKPKAGAS